MVFQRKFDNIYSHPLYAVLVLLLDEPDALQHVGDVVDAALLLHVQGVRGLRGETEESRHQRHLGGRSRSLTTLRSSTPPCALCSRATNLEVSSPRDFSNLDSPTAPTAPPESMAGGGRPGDLVDLGEGD